MTKTISADAPPETKMPDPTGIGTVNEQWAILQALAAGYNVARPILDRGADLWIETKAGIVRAQIKTACRGWRDKATWRAMTGETKSTQRRHRLNGQSRPRRWDYYRDRADVLIAVRPDREACWIIPTAHIHVDKTFMLSRAWLNRWDLIGEPLRTLAAEPAESSQANLYELEGSR